MNRRNLLKLMAFNALALPFSLEASSPTLPRQKRLILIELKGGNDGLNTVIPYADPDYYRLRPNIAIAKNKVLPLTDTLALHPSLKGLKAIFNKEELAIIQGVGYPNPNRSHFRSIEIWDTASNSDEYLDMGWLNTLTTAQQNKHLKGVVLSGEYGPLSGHTKGIIKINNIQGFIRQSNQIRGRISLVGDNNALLHILQTEAEVQKSANILKKSLSKKKALPFAFKKSDLGKQMHVVTELINSGTELPFFKVSLGSFDTHLNQPKRHARLLKELSENISTIRNNLIASGEWENTLIMTYSEFGRRAGENASRGTDHGTAAPHFVLGGSVKGGIYGKHPSLPSLGKNSDLIYTTDFRSLYKSITEEWFNTSSTQLKPFSPIADLKFNVKRKSILDSHLSIPIETKTNKNKVSHQNTKDRTNSSFINYLLN